MVAEDVVGTRRRTKNATEHDVGAESVVEDLVADLAVGCVSIQLSNRVPGTIIGSATSTTVVVGQRNPWDHGCARTVKDDLLSRSVSDANSVVSFVVDENAACGWNLPANRT